MSEVDPTARPDKGFWSMKRLVILVVGVCLINLFAVGVFFYAAGYTLKRQVEERELISETNQEIAINRAQDCKVQVALGITLDQHCLDPMVLKFYDPVELAAEGRFRDELRDILCFVARSEGGTFLEVCE